AAKPSLKISADLCPSIISKNVPAEAQPTVTVRVTMTLSPVAPAPLSFLRKYSLVEPHMDQGQSQYNFSGTYRVIRCPPDDTILDTPATYDGIVTLLPGVPATFDYDRFTGTDFYENYKSGEAYLLRLGNGLTTPLLLGVWSFRDSQKLQDLVDFDISQEKWPVLIVEGDKPDNFGPVVFTTHVPW
ncbi:uncharacterized protein K452DRAFT_287492, partial [Aplosporella prunicola CBS 121167]